MSLAQQSNLFGLPETIKVQRQPEAPVVFRTENIARPSCGDDPALREMAAAVYEDLGYDFFPADSELWMTLFEEADQVDSELCSILMYLRGGGARLIPNPKFGYIIRPIVGAGAWETKEAYDAERRALEPYREKLLALLKKLNESVKRRR